jgi:acyl-CoA thioesterase-1
MKVTQLDHRRRHASSGMGPARVDMDRARGRRKAALPFLASLVMALAGSPVQACTLAILGDSLAAGFGVEEGTAFPVRLERALRAHGTDCAVVNAGVSGDTSAGGAARVEWVLADRPSHLLVELGGNDALRALPVEQLEANLDRIIRTAKERGVEVMLAGMLAPPNLGSSYSEAFKRVYLDLARRHDIPLYPFFLDGAVLRAELMQPDGIHPNAKGVDVIVERIVPMIQSFLQDK